MEAKETTELDGPSVGRRLRDQLEASVEASVEGRSACAHPYETVKFERDARSGEPLWLCGACGVRVQPEHAGRSVIGQRFVAVAAAEPAGPAPIPSIIPDTANARAREIATAEAANATAPAGVSSSNFDTAMRGALTELRGLQGEIDALEARKEKVRANLREALMQSDRARYDYDGITATISEGARTPKVIERNRVPAEFLETTINTKKLGEALRAGKSVPGARLEVGQPQLRVVFDAPSAVPGGAA